ncbi:hypothetical protein [Fulvitalea axinellae]
MTEKKTFRLSADYIKKQKAKAIAVSVVLDIIVLAGITARLWYGRESDEAFWKVATIVLPTAMVAGVLVLRFFVRKANTRFKDFRITFDGKKLEQHAFEQPKLSIPLNEISDIVTDENGAVRVKGKSEEEIVLLNQLEGREELLGMIRR